MRVGVRVLVRVRPLRDATVSLLRGEGRGRCLGEGKIRVRVRGDGRVEAMVEEV